ncbi:MAG: primosomal protein N' [Methylobacillus sp.]|jgi:primosomal protein N' (replication factor Y)|nr:primosomal protein N' [Methylobacillus sp.]
MNILRIALDVPLATLFDYLDGGSAAQVGQRVLVPFGARKVIGIVIARSATSEFETARLKSIIRVFGDEPPIPPATLKLLAFCADYYQYPFGQALLAALPSRLREAQPAILSRRVGYALTEIARQGGEELIPKRAASQRKLYAALRDTDALDSAALALLSPGWRGALRAMREKNWVRETTLDQPSATGVAAPAPPLNADQQHTVQTILDGGGDFRVWLLHGITGSGKTEVYMRLLDAMLADNASQALVLVPEINLTPQLEARFRARFPRHSIVMLHSRMNESERLQGWLRAQNGEARIVIGTRLSVFTPMKNPALVIVDEEHDSSYKQQDAMRYSARDVAIMRAKMADIPIVLGSATPALETWHNAQTGRYHLLTLSQRAVQSAALPALRCIDTRPHHAQDGLSQPLLVAMRQRLARGEQSLLFINRRGYSPVLLCGACGWVAPCARCSSRLVVHLRERKLRCHHCGHEQRPPLQCPSCGNPDLHPTGHGTQRLEETLARHFPEARILRVDRDSMRRKNAIKDMTAKVHANEVDILVGTQMLAKGHDFPNLTLVGVMDTDSALFSPDFRAAERLFAQLLQVAGRAGRADKPGEVLIQTNFPDHALFAALQKQDYAQFAQSLLEERKLAHFPPWCFEALLRAEATHLAPVQTFLDLAAREAREIKSKITLYDIARPQMERLKGMERAQLLAQAASRQALQKFLQTWVARLRALPQASKVRWSVDVDPLEY